MCAAGVKDANIKPTFHIIILGSGGGPLEDNVTGFLVRSTETKWTKGSVLAVDAGTHLAAISRIFKEHLPTARTQIDVEDQHSTLDASTRSNVRSLNAASNEGGLIMTSGPFAGFSLPNETAQANAAYFVRNLITTYLITHPHLDHLAGFVINTAGFQHTSSPKRLAGLPATIDAFKKHIFNDVVWPNLSDEDGGVGLVSYMRLAEGGNLAIGEGQGRGYLEVCDGLAVKSWSISHGKCMHDKAERSSGSGHTFETFHDVFSRKTSQTALTRSISHHSRDHSLSGGPCVIDSSAFFLRADSSGDEVLIFGDVEPDSLSLSARNIQVWQDAAPKVVAGHLKGIFIECSYNESQPDDILFGHLAPRHVIAELQMLAAEVRLCVRTDAASGATKRKRSSIGGSQVAETTAPTRRSQVVPSSQRQRQRSASTKQHDDITSSPARVGSLDEAATEGSPSTSSNLTQPVREALSEPLSGLRIIIIHVKDSLKDEPDASRIILEQLNDIGAQADLGCSFEISKSGTSIWL